MIARDGHDDDDDEASTTRRRQTACSYVTAYRVPCVTTAWHVVKMIAVATGHMYINAYTPTYITIQSILKPRQRRAAVNADPAFAVATPVAHACQVMNNKRTTTNVSGRIGRDRG